MLTIVSAKINHFLYTNSTIRSRFKAKLRIFIFFTPESNGLIYAYKTVALSSQSCKHTQLTSRQQLIGLLACQCSGKKIQ